MTNKIPEHIRQEIEQAIDGVKAESADARMKRIWKRVLRR